MASLSLSLSRRIRAGQLAKGRSPPLELTGDGQRQKMDQWPDGAWKAPAPPPQFPRAELGGRGSGYRVGDLMGEIRYGQLPRESAIFSKINKMFLTCTVPPGRRDVGWVENLVSWVFSKIPPYIPPCPFKARAPLWPG